VAIKPNWITLTAQEQAELDSCVGKAGWRIVPQSELPSVFPVAFREKLDSALLIASPTSTGGAYLAFSAHRIDFKDKAIDIEPFGLIVHSTGPSPSGVFLHHGNWPGRTENPPQRFWAEVLESGIGNYFHTNPPEGAVEGTLEQLPKGHRGAFNALVSEIRRRVDDHDK
jgi:hypothetical protein